MTSIRYQPPLAIKPGLSMTLYTALLANRNRKKVLPVSESSYQEVIFNGYGEVPLFGQINIPQVAHGTLIATYGITGTLGNQWFLHILREKALNRDYAVVLFDWRAHGESAKLSPTLTSDGLYEGKDFIHIAAQALEMGCPPPFWFLGYSLGGQLALWGIKEAQEFGEFRGLKSSDIAGGAVICPNLDSNRSLSYLEQAPLGKYLEKAITKEVKKLAWQIYEYYPRQIDPEAIARVKSIRQFDQELVISPLGFSSTWDYYRASSPLPFLGNLQKPTLIIYAEDDPLFDPSITWDLAKACGQNPLVELLLTKQGGHVGYISSRACQEAYQDADQWWAWNRILSWLDRTKFLYNT
jgi:hypothetical protein